jgi:hypothetical protein
MVGGVGVGLTPPVPVPVTVAGGYDVFDEAANTAVGTTRAAIKAKTMAKTKSFFFIHSPKLFFYFILFYLVFRVSQLLLLLLIEPRFGLRFTVACSQMPLKASRPASYSSLKAMNTRFYLLGKTVIVPLPDIPAGGGLVVVVVVVEAVLLVPQAAKVIIQITHTVIIIAVLLFISVSFCKLVVNIVFS